MASKNKLEFAAKNVKPLSAWLKRFSSIDDSLLLEIDLDTNSFNAKSYNSSRSLVKMSWIAFDDAGLVFNGKKESGRIKVGIYNIARLMKIMDQFSDSESTIIVEYSEVVNTEGNRLVAERLLFKGKSLRMTVDCTSLNIFKYISDELFEDKIATTEIQDKFELSKELIDRIITLNGLDNDYKFISFESKDEYLSVLGKSYNLEINKTDVVSSAVNIYKDHFSSIDPENYAVELGDDRLIFRSTDSNTVSVISNAELDE